MGRMIGIDIGTTNSVVAVIEGGQPTVIPSAEGNRTIPSVVAFAKGGERLVGQIAKRQAVTNPANTISSIKRFMGRRAADTGMDEERKRVPYAVVEEAGSLRVKTADGQSFAPEAISAMILGKLKADAEAYLGEKVTEAVITVPAYFDDAARQATKDAGRIAGLDVKRIVNEPTAAALAYGFDERGERTIAVFDLGGGTFDISILALGDGVIEVKATNGDTHIGGDDWDQRLVNDIASTFKRETGVDVTGDPQAVQRLREAAEKAKIELSSTTQTEVNLPYLTADATGPKHLVTTITRAHFESLTEDLVSRTTAPVLAALKDAGLDAKGIDGVLMVGGMTRVPSVLSHATALFGGREPMRNVNPDEVVALGAALQAGVMGGSVKDLLLIDVTPLSIGIETSGGANTVVIERNTTVPTAKTQVFSTAADNQTQVEVHILQGERPMAADNRSLGRFILDGLPAAPRGVPQIEVTFELDANGILEVRAKDRATGRVQQSRVTGSSTLPKSEVERMLADAERYASDDKRRREAIDARNTADSVIAASERTLADLGGSVAPGDRAEAERLVAELRAVTSEDPADISAATERLRSAMSRIGAAAYAASSAQTAPAQPADGEPEVIEGDATEI